LARYSRPKYRESGKGASEQEGVGMAVKSYGNPMLEAATEPMLQPRASLRQELAGL
jgi:hypothetical protein